VLDFLQIAENQALFMLFLFRITLFFPLTISHHYSPKLTCFLVSNPFLRSVFAVFGEFW